MYDFENGKVKYNSNLTTYDHKEFHEETPFMLVPSNFCLENRTVVDAEDDEEA